MLSVKQVCELSGIEPQVLRNWIAAGLVKPTHHGDIGPGKGHEFSVVQSVGLCVVHQLRQTERGCVKSYISTLVEAFSNVTEQWLQTDFHNGQKYFVMVHYGKPLMHGDPRLGPDVEAIFQQVANFKQECNA